MDSRFQQALAAVRTELHARPDVIGLLFFGSAQRGEAKPGSDLDLCAITSETERWSECRFVDGVEVQLQFGPVQIWQRRLAARQPVVTSAFATGELLFDKTGEGTELKLLAEQTYVDGPRALTAAEIDLERYKLTNMVRDLEDMPEHSVEARMLSGQIVVDSLKAWCAFRNIWAEKKPAVLLRTVRNTDSSLAAKVECFYHSPSPDGAIVIADSVLEIVGGRTFAFSTPTQPV